VAGARWGSNALHVKDSCCTRLGTPHAVYVRKQAFFTFAFELHNRGPLSVRIEGAVNGATRPFSVDRLATSMPMYGESCGCGFPLP
jgi:hypothetical protein